MRLSGAILLALTLSLPATAKDVFLPIAGSVGNFRTDARIFNPSATKDITVHATFLPSGSDVSHPNNSGAQAKTITIPRRSEAVYDDVVSSLFQRTGLGGIRLQSDDDFLATQRIYADEAAGTLGQFIVGATPSAALSKGVVMQLRSKGTGGKGSFRTNVGFLNPNPSEVNVTVRLYDALNGIAAVKTMRLLPLGVVQPLNVNGFFNAPGADLSNFFITFEASLPIFGYGSVIDNATVDPMYVPAQPDTGVDLVTTKTFDITLKTWEIVITPEPNIAPGDRVVFRIHAEDHDHGFELLDAKGNVVIPSHFFSPGEPPVTFSFTASETGRYDYYCTLGFCGGSLLGHSSMGGSFDVGGSGGATAKPAPRRHHHH